jgi:lipopolysaccharide export system protein LptA
MTRTWPRRNPRKSERAARRLAAPAFALLAGVLLAVALPWSGPLARAEKADRDKPVNLEADRVTVDDAKQLATFEGNVVLTQGTLQIRGDRMEIRQDKEGFKYGTTWGNLAYFRQKRERMDEYIEGWAERIVRRPGGQDADVHRAMMKRNEDEVRGNTSPRRQTEFYSHGGGSGRHREQSRRRKQRSCSPAKDKPACGRRSAQARRGVTAPATKRPQSPPRK